MEEIAREKEREQREDDAADGATDSSVEEVRFVFPDCPPPNELDSAEREAWDETVALIKHCRNERRESRCPSRSLVILQGNGARS